VPAAKRLSQHARDATFRTRRHAHLLEGPVVKWPVLAILQARYVGTQHGLERRAIAVEFERAVRALETDEDELVERARAEAELQEIVRADPVEVDLDELARWL
jgi:hypothetical protein